jgi:hypothetical protein
MKRLDSTLQTVIHNTRLIHETEPRVLLAKQATEVSLDHHPLSTVPENVFSMHHL